MENSKDTRHQTPDKKKTQIQFKYLINEACNQKKLTLTQTNSNRNRNNATMIEQNNFKSIFGHLRNNFIEGLTEVPYNQGKMQVIRD